MTTRPGRVDAWELDNFSTNYAAPNLAHHLVDRLLRATPELMEIHGFDTEEGLNDTGWDGTTSAEPGSHHLPAGFAAWEISTKDDPRRKAETVYQTRTANPQGVNPAETTLVIVSTRKWPRMDKWRKAKLKDGIWHNIITINASRLEKWLRDAPDVWRWLTEEIRPAPLPPAPKLLPPGLNDFIGREEELQELRYTPGGSGGPRVVAIDGKPGVGKTALAVQYAQEIASHFPDGVLHADLRGTDKTPVDPSEIQSRFLQSLGAFHGNVSEDHDYLTGLYRTAFQGRKVLLVLDNAADEDQVRALLPPSSNCTVIITSRTSLPGLDSAHHVHLDTFSPDEAFALMASIVGERQARAESESTASIVKLCDNLPLAIRIAGARTKTEGWSLAHVAHLLRSEHDRLDHLRAGDRAVRASFALSYRKLKGSHRELFRRLSLIPGQVFDAELAKVVVDEELRKVRKWLRRLAEANLIERANASVGYTFHDLIRLYSNERVEKEDGLTACRKIQGDIVEYLLHHANRCGSALSSRNDMESLRWLDLRYDNVLNAVRLAVGKLGRRGQALSTIVGLHEYLKMRNAWLTMDDLAVLGLKAVELLRAKPTRTWTTSALAMSELELLLRRAEAASFLRDHKEATAYCDQATELATEDTSPAMLSGIENMRGNVFHGQNRDEEALQHYRRAAQLCQRSDNLTQRRIVLYNTGNALRAQGRLREALHLLQEEATYCRKRGSRWSEAITLDTMGITYKGLGRYAEAREVLETAIGYFDEFDDVKNKGNALFDLGNVLTELDELEAALHSFKQDLEICQSLQDELGTTQAKVAVSRTLTEMGPERLDEARQWIESALEAFAPEHDPVSFGQALTQLAQVDARMGRFSEASESLTQAVELFRYSRDWHAEAMAHFAIGQVRLKQDDTTGALESLSLAAQIVLPREEFADRIKVCALLASVHADLQDREEAERWLQAAQESRREMNEA